MSDHLEEYIVYRISKSKEAIRDAEVLAKNGSWNACVNRLYYACYYIVSALLLRNKLSTQTHSGVKAMFNLHFVKPGKVTADDGKLYGDLLDWRQKGDYGDMYDFDKVTVESLLPVVETFVKKMELLIQ